MQTIYTIIYYIKDKQKLIFKIYEHLVRELFLLRAHCFIAHRITIMSVQPQRHTILTSLLPTLLSR